MKHWDWEGNRGTDPYSVACCSQKKVSWICTEHGPWDATPNHRVSHGSGCPECGKRQSLGFRPRRGLLRDEMPGVYAELHPTKNAGVDIEELTCGSARRVWWLCQSNDSRPEGCQHEHKWEARVDQRCRHKRPAGCPFCDGSLVCPCKSLTVLQPTLLQHWDFARNAIPLQEPLDPSQMGQHSRRKVWWRHECADGRVHHWRAAIYAVVRTFSLRGRLPCADCAAVAGAGCRPGRLVKRK